MSTIDDALCRLAEPRVLQERLEASLGAKSKGICVMLHYKGESHSAAIHDCSVDTPVDIGCVAKALTATLVAIAQQEGRLELGDTVARHIGNGVSNEALRRHLESTKLYHLLNHSSGLDQSLLDAAPIGADGCIDAPRMLDVLAESGTLCPPGILYNYSNVGAWLTAAVLEAAYGRAYAAILEQKLLRPLAAGTLHTPDNKVVCAAVGWGLRLSAEDLLAFALLHLNGDGARPELNQHLTALRTQFPFPLPSWPPTGKAMLPGWIDFGGNFGQSGYGEEGAGVLRFFPDERAAVVVTSTHPNLANTTLTVLLKDALKGFSGLSPPRSLTDDAWVGIDPSAYLGTFENGKYRLIIDVATNGQLRGAVFRKHNELGVADREPHIKRYFRAAQDDVFLPSQPEQLVLPVMQFHHRGAGDRFQLLHTGRYAFSRAAGEGP